MSEQAEQEIQSYIQLPIDWHVSENLQSRYVNNVIVQPGKYEITIFFFETQLPPFVGSAEENKDFLLKRGSIRAECVGKMIVDPELMPEIIKALQTGLDGYNASKVHEGEVE